MPVAVLSASYPIQATPLSLEEARVGNKEKSDQVLANKSALEASEVQWLVQKPSCLALGSFRTTVTNLSDLTDHQWPTDHRLATAALECTSPLGCLG